ncbi:hypothetical protein BSF41_31830 [Flavobacterium sp. ACN2]|jgi:hypothetical protein|uniref:hypothetical protein n=1 Tax=Flavobacterium sp. ACN2 TaxID=1975676 RepID=UPI000BB35E66|nr:hypothetical protein [Flavobacterium sp. ACN2]PBI86730.1 hypothetical protein BSF41_31830 [Flavobacterium sp. ACN2]
MKNISILLLLFLIGCSDKIQKTDNPIEKSIIILEAISKQKYKLVREEYVGRKETREKYKNELDTLSIQIFNALKKHGFPNKEKVIISVKEKLQIPKDYGDEFNGKDSIEIVSTKIELGSKKDCEIEMGFVLKNNEARLLRVGFRDFSVHSH